MSSAQLNERLKRDRAAFLKSMGFESEEQAKTMRQQHEQARQASMTNEQRLQEENDRLKRERDEAAAARARAEADVQLVQQCAARGIRDVDYARYLVQGAGVIPDLGSFLDSQLQDQRKKVALGIDAPTTVVSTPLNTSVVNPNAPPPPPSTPNGANGQVNAMNMSKAEYDAYCKRQGYA